MWDNNIVAIFKSVFMKRLKFLLWCVIALLAVSCHKELPDNPSIDEIDGKKVSLNELAGVTDAILDGGLYSFTLPASYLSGENVIIYAKTEYRNLANKGVSDSVPTLRICAYGTALNQRDSTIAYSIGSRDGSVIQQWRLPPLPTCFTDVKIKIYVPDDKQLVVSSLSNEDLHCKPTSESSSIRINAHGSPMTGKFNTEMGFLWAAKAGYPSCVAVPKRTADGVWVCFHDEDNINEVRYSNGAFAVCERTKVGDEYVYTQYDEQGNVIGDSPMPISSLTWDFLRDKIIYNESYYGIWGTQHIPTLEDFFRVCSSTGMIPMLSVHPALTVSEWQEIRTIAQRYRVLNKLDVKLRQGDDYVDPAIQALGNDILRYSIYVSSETEYQWALNKLNSLGSIGKQTPAIEMLYKLASREKANLIISNGFTCSVFDGTRKLTGERSRQWIFWGVTEITSNYNHSYGLNW